MLLDPQAGQEDSRPESRPVPKKPALPSPRPQKQNIPLPKIKKENRPSKNPPSSSSSHQTIQQGQIPGRSPAHINQSTKRACNQRIPSSSSFFKKFFKTLLLRLPFLRSHPIHSFIKPLQSLLLGLGHPLRNLNH